MIFNPIYDMQSTFVSDGNITTDLIINKKYICNNSVEKRKTKFKKKSP